MEAVLSAECERARARASLALDCELSELERAHLRSHLAGCADCAAVVAGLRELTHELRAAPLPRPTRSFAPRRRGRALVPVLAAVAVLLAAVAGSVAGSLRPAPAPSQVTVTGAKLSALFAAVPQVRPGTRLPSQLPV